jgi:hypothetical protein
MAAAISTMSWPTGPTLVLIRPAMPHTSSPIGDANYTHAIRELVLTQGFNIRRRTVGLGRVEPDRADMIVHRDEAGVRSLPNASTLDFRSS